MIALIFFLILLIGMFTGCVEEDLEPIKKEILDVQAGISAMFGGPTAVKK